MVPSSWASVELSGLDLLFFFSLSTIQWMQWYKRSWCSRCKLFSWFCSCYYACPFDIAKTRRQTEVGVFWFATSSSREFCLFSYDWAILKNSEGPLLGGNENDEATGTRRGSEVCTYVYFWKITFCMCLHSKQICNICLYSIFLKNHLSTKYLDLFLIAIH